MRSGGRIAALDAAIDVADRPQGRVGEATEDRYVPAARAESIAVAWWLPFVAAAALMLWGFIRLQASAPYAAEQLYQAAATGRLAWSDIISIYGRGYIAGHPLPYTSNGHI